MASDLDAVRAAIEQHVRDNWSATAVAWPGVDFEPGDEPWLQLAILWGDGFEDTMGEEGEGLNEIVGVLNANLFDKPGRGLGELYRLADEFRALFNRKTISGIRFRAASGPRRTQSPLEERDWEQVNVSVPFDVDETV